MTETECRSKIRCAMGDRTGQLRFESFSIVDAPDCAQTADRIRDYLVGRALAEVDTGFIRATGGEGHPLCARVVAELVAESQETFDHLAPRANAATEQQTR